MDSWANTAEAVLRRLSFWLCAAIAAASAVLLWAPSIGPVPLDRLREDFGAYIAAAFVVFAFLAVARVGQHLTAGYRARARAKQRSAHAEEAKKERAAALAAKQAKVLAHLQTLSPAEIVVLGDMVEANQRTIATSMDDVVVGMLRAKGLLNLPDVGGNYNFNSIPFSIPSFVWDALLLDRDRYVSALTPKSHRRTGRRNSDGF